MDSTYILDANILLSGLLSQKPFYEILAQRNKIYIPEFGYTELGIYSNLILKRSKLEFPKLKAFTLRFVSGITVVPEFIYAGASTQSAMQWCADIDLKDTAYVALAIELECTLLTRDKPLQDGLKKKGFDPVMLFDEFVRSLIHQE
ncbi:MAG: PIN domain-containing protein [Chitinophagales bacterium]|nr:PIN domain-containing protein [Chitinophagales bacterium]